MLSVLFSSAVLVNYNDKLQFDGVLILQGCRSCYTDFSQSTFEYKVEEKKANLNSWNLYTIMIVEWCEPQHSDIDFNFRLIPPLKISPLLFFLVHIPIVISFSDMRGSWRPSPPPQKEENLFFPLLRIPFGQWPGNRLGICTKNGLSDKFLAFSRSLITFCPNTEGNFEIRGIPRAKAEDNEWNGKGKEDEDDWNVNNKAVSGKKTV